MQYILTEEEYNDLKSRSEANQNKPRYLQLELSKLTTKYQELQVKYNQLLIFGVASSNERLKSVQR